MKFITLSLECKVPAAVCENRVYGAKQLIKDTNIKLYCSGRWFSAPLDKEG